MYRILDDFISKGYQQELSESFQKTSWYFTESLTFSEGDKNTGFYKMIYGLSSDPEEDPVMDYEMYDLLFPMIKQAFRKFEIDPQQLYRIKAGLFVRHQINSIDDLHHEPHVDDYSPHFTMLYYFMDSDGPTYIFDDHKNIIDKIEPKMGRAVLMSGDTYHASSPPRESSKRIVLNINFGDKY